MPSMFGGSNTDRDYAPHMWLGDHFIHNSEKILEINGWWYRGGRLDDETIVAERWKGGRFLFDGQSDHEMVPADQIPDELLSEMKNVSRAAQEAFQGKMEQKFSPPK